MLRKIFVLFTIVAALLLIASCRKKEAFQPSRLIANTFSGQSVQTVERKLDLRAGDWNVIEDQRSLSGQAEPPSRLYIISKKDFPLYGANGELQLTFFNDELVASRYYADPNSICTAIEREQEIALCGVGESRIQPSTRIWIGKDNEGRTYVGWIDKVRQAALDNWNAHRPK